MQNFNSLGSLVLEISAFQYEACHGFRAGASVHKLFVGGVYVCVCVFVRINSARQELDILKICEYIVLAERRQMLGLNQPLTIQFSHIIIIV